MNDYYEKMRNLVKGYMTANGVTEKSSDYLINTVCVELYELLSDAIEKELEDRYEVDCSK